MKMVMTLDIFCSMWKAAGYHKGRLEGIDEALKALVYAGVVSKEECDKEFERYMREDYEEDEDEMWSIPKCCEPIGTYNSMLLEEDVEDILLHQDEKEAYFLQQGYFKDLM